MENMEQNMGQNLEQRNNDEIKESVETMVFAQSADRRSSVDEIGKSVVEQAAANIELAGSQAMLQSGDAATPQETVSAEEGSSNENVADSFAGLPIESLICAPILAAAKGQQELTAVYLDGIMKLAYKDGKAAEPGKTAKETNSIQLTVQRPVTKEDGTVTTQDVTINAPLLSLVPVPAFTMDELTVDFEMEVKQSDIREDKSKEDISSTLSYKSWFGLNANITGNISSESTHKRESDNSATYKIHARAVQQEPSEGMAKLTSLFAQMMEPIPVQKQ